MKIVIDTNVIVSALLNSSSTPGEIFLKVFNKKLFISYDNRILVEYIDVLNRDKFKINKDLVKIIIEFIKKEWVFILAESVKIDFSDKSDKKFYEVYKSTGTQYFITGNIKHFPKEKEIVTPKEFLNKFSPEFRKEHH
ncbi:MAG: putative toxin-antitoxin system toxin component, PIN family [Treponema sp.]|jgi:putative PIN family toxin of toxin-antitoxin system|nr:putative toxin-antitoxin system toxin component, PIN family [Treponema sp.]